MYVHVDRETDAGLIVSGAKMVATGSALTHYNFIAHANTGPIKTKEFAVTFIAAMGTPGVKLICRASYAMTAEVMGSPFDYPLSSRLDENDAIIVFDQALIPWENIFVYEDVEKSDHLAFRDWLPAACHVPWLHATGGETGLYYWLSSEGYRDRGNN